MYRTTNHDLTALNYHPFGMLLVDRIWEIDYRYGFNGHEVIKELSGNHEFIDFGARIYSSSLGRFISTDPLAGQYVWQSPYAYYLNSPIAMIDYLGMGEEPNFFQKAKNFVKGVYSVSF